MKTRRNTAQARPQRRPVFQGPRTRVGLLAGDHMEFGGIENVEDLLLQGGVVLAPIPCESAPSGPRFGSVTVLHTASIADIENGRLAGVVVPGSMGDLTPDGVCAFDKLVNTAQGRDLPVMAFGEGVARTLRAMGFEPPEDLPPALLIDKGVRILETPAEVNEALSAFRRRAA